MNIDIHINQITPGNPCKRISNITWWRCSLEVEVLCVEQLFDQYGQMETPNTLPNQSY